MLRTTRREQVFEQVAPSFDHRQNWCPFHGRGQVKLRREARQDVVLKDFQFWRIEKPPSVRSQRLTRRDKGMTRHGPGSKARLAILIALDTGMARQDLYGSNRDMLRVKDSKLRIEYARGKTGVAADLPVIPELEEELLRLPPEQHLFLPKDDLREPYKVTSFGNWFRDRCREAGVRGSIHGLRKAGATRLADVGASDWEIASYLAHTDTTQASVYTKAANRSKLADSGFEKLGKLSNSPGKLDRQED